MLYKTLYNNRLSYKKKKIPAFHLATNPLFSSLWKTILFDYLYSK
jgi:hypothetical protein